MFKNNSRQNAALALFLMISAASSGIAARLYMPGIAGQFLFAATRVWILVFPLVWFLRVDRRRATLSPPSLRDVLAGTILGIFMFSVILGAYCLAGQYWIDPEIVRAKAQQIGLANPISYLLGAIYFTFINSLVEEYIWRWFVYQKCEVLVSGNKAVYLAALCFTLHHTIALTAYSRSWLIVAFGSIGVFVAGAVWSWCYLRYRSLWACYISHLLADLAIALIGWDLLFEGALFAAALVHELPI